MNKNMKPQVRISRISESGTAMSMMVCNGWKVAREELRRLNAKQDGVEYVAFYA